jgi:hypothetical protein
VFVGARAYEAAGGTIIGEPNGQPSPTGATGVGSGFINLKVDAEGRPIAYLFALVAIGRVEPI